MPLAEELFLVIARLLRVTSFTVALPRCKLASSAPSLGPRFRSAQQTVRSSAADDEVSESAARRGAVKAAVKTVIINDFTVQRAIVCLFSSDRGKESERKTCHLSETDRLTCINPAWRPGWFDAYKTNSSPHFSLSIEQHQSQPHHTSRPSPHDTSPPSSKAHRPSDLIYEPTSSSQSLS